MAEASIATRSVESAVRLQLTVEQGGGDNAGAPVELVSVLNTKATCANVFTPLCVTAYLVVILGGVASAAAARVQFDVESRVARIGLERVGSRGGPWERYARFFAVNPPRGLAPTTGTRTPIGYGVAKPDTGRTEAEMEVRSESGIKASRPAAVETTIADAACGKGWSRWRRCRT